MSLDFLITHRFPDSLNSSFEVTQRGLAHDVAIETQTDLWTACGILTPHLCKKAEEHARVWCKIYIGEDETFDKTVGKLAHETMAGGEDLGMASADDFMLSWWFGLKRRCAGGLGA